MSTSQAEGFLQDKGSRFIQLHDKTDVFSIAGFISDFTSLLLLHHHYRYCCLLTWQQRWTLHKLTLFIAIAGSFTSNMRIHYPVGTRSLCALPLSLRNRWLVCDSCLQISASVFEVDSLSFNSSPRRGVRQKTCAVCSGC